MQLALEQTLRDEVNPRLNFRNLLSAHTANRKGGPLWPNSSLDKCFSAVNVDGQLEGHLRLPNSFDEGDGIPLHVRSNLHPNTTLGQKAAFNSTCFRALVDLLLKDASKVRLVPSNFRPGADGIRAVLRCVKSLYCPLPPMPLRAVPLPPALDCGVVQPRGASPTPPPPPPLRTSSLLNGAVAQKENWVVESEPVNSGNSLDHLLQDQTKRLM